MTIKLPFLALHELVHGELYRVRVTNSDGSAQLIDAFCETDVAGDEIRFVTGDGEEINGIAIEVSPNALALSESVDHR